MDVCKVRPLSYFTPGWCVLNFLPFITQEKILDVREHNQKLGKTSKQNKKQNQDVFISKFKSLFSTLEPQIQVYSGYLPPRCPQSPTLIKSKIDFVTVNSNYWL